MGGMEGNYSVKRYFNNTSISKQVTILFNSEMIPFIYKMY